MTDNYDDYVPNWYMIPIEESSSPIGNLNETAYVDVSLYEDQATDRRALARARKRFLEISESPAMYLKKVEISNKRKIVLFTSVQIEYSVKVIANSFAVNSYYNNLNGG